MKTTTLRISRVIRAPKEIVYGALLDREAFARWYPPRDLVGKVHEMDTRVGGRYRMTIAAPDGSWALTFGGIYQELVPGERVVFTNVPETSDPQMQPSMRIMIQLTSVEEGTRVDIVHEGIPQGGARGATEGWRQSLDGLALIVEAIATTIE